MSFTLKCDNCGEESKIELHTLRKRGYSIQSIEVVGRVKISFHEIYGIKQVKCKCMNELKRNALVAK